MNKWSMRLLSMLLCGVLVLGVLPGGVSAELSGITGVVPTDEYTFFDFEDFKEMCQDAAVFEETMTCVYTGFVDFVLEEDVTVPKTVTLKTDGAGIQIPAGVTVTLEGNMAVSQLEIQGKLENFGRLEMNIHDGGSLTLSGAQSYTDCQGDARGALYVPVKGAVLPESWLVGAQMEAFWVETVAEGEASFWKLTTYETETPKPEPEPEQKPEKVEVTPMYRLYNPNTGEHFYTGSLEERDMLVNAGWQYEGVAWNAPTKSGAPVYRLFNPNNGDHHYTMSAQERDNLVEVGWQYEGVAWNSAPANGDDVTPLYRLYNPNADCGSHHYTGSTEERDYLVSLGWHYEGIGWFGIR